jgi:putative signal transducing protein
MFCPVCESEYQPGITRCPDDQSELVSQLDAKAGRDSSEARFLPLHTLGSPIEAEMVNDILRQNGIRSMVKSGGADALAPLLSSTAEGSVILVDERDFDRAQELYRAFFGEDETPLTGAAFEEDEETKDEG